MNLKFTVTGEELSDILLNIATTRPVFIWGAPGIGKSALCKIRENFFLNNTSYRHPLGIIFLYSDLFLCFCVICKISNSETAAAYDLYRHITVCKSCYVPQSFCRKILHWITSDLDYIIKRPHCNIF